MRPLSFDNLETEDAHADARLFRSKKLSILFGGTLDEKKRREVGEKKRARIDVLEMESLFGAQVFDFSRFHTDAKTGRKARCLHYLARKTRMWSFFLALYSLPHIKNDDLVFATGEDVGFALGLLMRCLRVKRPRLVVRLEQPTYGRTMLRRCVFNLYMQLALKRVDKTVCRTTAHLQYLHSVFNVSEKALAFARETTDPCFYRPDAAGCLEKPDFLPEEPYVISAGAEMRDYATLIEAVKGLPVQLIIGAGSPWAHVRFDAEKRELPPNVQVASFTPLQMRELYRAAEFAVVPVKPTLRACGTNVVLESWAMGKGVIITRTVGQLDYSTDGEDVLFVEPCDVEDMRAKIVHLLRRPAEARRLGQNGLRTVQEQRNLERYVQQLETLFASTLRNEYVAQEPSPAAAQVSGC